MHQKRQSTMRGLLDQSSRELGARVKPVAKLPDRVEEGRTVWVEPEDVFYVGIHNKWRPLAGEARREYSSEIEAEA